jgi:hypothetical protein
VLSKWSDWQTVDLSTWSTIDGVAEDAAQMAAEDVVKVFSSVGTQLGTMTYGEFCGKNMPKGVYVVKGEKGALKVAK